MGKMRYRETDGVSDNQVKDVTMIVGRKIYNSSVRFS